MDFTFNDFITIVVNYLPLFIGWFLGIISALTIDLLKKCFDRSEIKKGILIELNEVQLVATSACISTIPSTQLTQGYANWIRPFFEKLITSRGKDYSIDEKILNKMTEKEFYEILSTIITNRTPGTSNIATKIKTPYLDAKINFISFFNEKLQSLVIRLKRDVDLINDDFSQITFYHSKTFDNLSENNREIVQKNTELISERIERRSQNLIKLIQQIIDSN